MPGDLLEDILIAIFGFIMGQLMTQTKPTQTRSSSTTVNNTIVQRRQKTNPVQQPTHISRPSITLTPDTNNTPPQQPSDDYVSEPHLMKCFDVNTEAYRTLRQQFDDRIWASYTQLVQDNGTEKCIDVNSAAIINRGDKQKILELFSEYEVLKLVPQRTATPNTQQSTPQPEPDPEPTPQQPPNAPIPTPPPATPKKKDPNPKPETIVLFFPNHELFLRYRQEVRAIANKYTTDMVTVWGGEYAGEDPTYLFSTVGNNSVMSATDITRLKEIADELQKADELRG